MLDFFTPLQWAMILGLIVVIVVLLIVRNRQSQG
jgi:hypothetical protein